MLARHKHVHLFEDGLREYWHVHTMPTSEGHMYALAKHHHGNGFHSHAHINDHHLYKKPEVVDGLKK